jgi:hypothetical protein
VSEVMIVATSVAAPTAPTERSRRSGYAPAVVVNGVLLVAINIWPGWSVVPVLTTATTAVIPVVNLSLVVGMVANVIYLCNDSRFVKSLGDLVTTSIALVVLIRLWQVFPFDVSGTWQTLFRLGLALVGLGCAVGVVVCLTRFIGALTSPLRRIT